jgi:hypothetical protein
MIGNIDFRKALMTAGGGGVSDDLGWLSMADIQQMTRDASRKLKDFGLHPNEPVLVPIGGKAEDIAAILAVVGANGVAAPFHHKTHTDTRAICHNSARFGKTQRSINNDKLRKSATKAPVAERRGYDYIYIRFHRQAQRCRSGAQPDFSQTCCYP